MSKKSSTFAPAFDGKPLVFGIFTDENSRREKIVLRSKGGLGSLLYD
jgi:hypothetical protein